MHRTTRPLLWSVAAGLLAFLAPNAVAQTVTTQQVITGVSLPMWVDHAPNDYSRIFVIEQHTGAIKIYGLPNYNLIGTFGTVSGVTQGTEQGLLGMAFHPNYAANGKVYCYYTTSGGGGIAGQDVLAVFQRDPSNPNLLQTPGTIIFTYPDPATNHNGGWLTFGPDGYLYLAIGDGGGQNDSGTGHDATTGNGQSIKTPLGKILRFDVDGTNGPNGLYGIPPTNPYANATDTTIRKEIWAYGLRNPFRNDIDPLTGDLIIADVGQNLWEEVDVQPHDVNGSQGGRNYGWRCFESDATFNTLNNCAGAVYGVGNVPILLKYGHTSAVAPTNRTGNAIIGGMVYRGCAIPDLYGTYFFVDNGFNWGFSVNVNVNANTYSNPVDRTTQLYGNGAANISSFGRDAYGELYLCSAGNGRIYKVVRATGTAPSDCNANGKPDCQEIADGSVADLNANNIPDTCEQPFAISLSSPANGATGVSLTPTLSWSASSNAASYSVTIANDAALTSVVASASGLASPTYNVGGGVLAQGQTYYWGAAAINANGATASTPLSFSFVTVPPPCIGDINGDGHTNTIDLGVLLSNFGASVTPNTGGDLNGDGVVNSLDLGLLLSHFGC